MGKGGDLEAPGSPSHGKAEAGSLSSTLHSILKTSTRIIGLRQSTSQSKHSNSRRPSGRHESSRGSTTAQTANEGAASKTSKQQLTEEEKTFWNARKLKLSADAKRIWALGIVIVIGGQLFGWNIHTLESGFGSFFIAAMLMSSGYIILCFSLAEMTSAMPFSGGAYGYARVTQGTFMGYIVGCCEMLQYIGYVAAAVLSLGQMITEVTQLDRVWEPLYWFVFFVTALIIYIEGGSKFWTFTLCAAIGMLSISLVYVLGSIPHIDFLKYHKWPGEANPYFMGGVSAFMTALPTTAWFYVGCETLALASEETFKPKQNVALGLVTCVLTLFVTCMGSIFCALGQSPGISGIAGTLLVYEAGFRTMFKIGHGVAIAIALPSAWGTTFGFIFCYSRQMFAMARSGLIPTGLSLTTKRNGSPYVALIVGSICAYAIATVGWYIPKLQGSIFQVCIAMAFAVYIVQAISYLVLFHSYPNIKRSFFSPFGLAGAYWTSFVFGLGLIGSLFFQDNTAEVLAFISIYIILCSMYYWLVSRHSQVISPEEEAVMFIAYVIKTNQQRAAKNKLNRLKNDKTLLGAFRRLLLGGRMAGGNRTSHDASGTATTNMPDSAATTARLKEINARKARLSAAVTKKDVNTPPPPRPSTSLASTGEGPPSDLSTTLDAALTPATQRLSAQASCKTVRIDETDALEGILRVVTVRPSHSSANAAPRDKDKDRSSRSKSHSEAKLTIDIPRPSLGADPVMPPSPSSPMSPPTSPMSHFFSPRSTAPPMMSRTSVLRGRGISGERAAAIRARFGLLGVLLVALYNLLVCACARYEVEVVGDMPQAQEELARLEAAGDQEGMQRLLKGMIKIKQDRDDVNFFFRQLLKKKNNPKVIPGAAAAAGAGAAAT